MSTPNKSKGTAPGKPASELTRLKFNWLHTMSDEFRVYWRQQFISPRTQSDIRSELFKKLKINLREDNQLTFFRQWLGEQDIRDAESEANERDQHDLEAQGLQGEQLRQELIDRMQRRALSRGDFAQGAAGLKRDLAERRFQFEQELAAEAKKSDQQKALELCLTESKSYPEVAEQFKQAFAALKKAKGGK